ncbi:MAG: hypothetical protein MMC33_004695 [Icmadophila ericetorum]|nr:hypothetical protein [Icmadophila ericetorum]
MPPFDPNPTFDLQSGEGDVTYSSVNSLFAYTLPSTDFDSYRNSGFVLGSSANPSFNGSAENGTTSLWNSSTLNPQFCTMGEVATNTDWIPGDLNTMFADDSGRELSQFGGEFHKIYTEDLSVYSQFSPFPSASVTRLDPMYSENGSHASATMKTGISDADSIQQNLPMKCLPSNDRQLLSSFGQDRSKPFACTNRCGLTFKRKDDWKKHEERNFSPNMWRCWKLSCMADKTAYSRKDKFRNHLRSKHGIGSFTEEEINSHRVPVNVDFDRRCIIRSCDKLFHRWNERIDHIWKHFCKPWNVSQWRETDEIKEPDEAETVSDLGTSGSDSSDVSQGHLGLTEMSTYSSDAHRSKGSNGRSEYQIGMDERPTGGCGAQRSVLEVLATLEAYTGDVDHFQRFLMTGISKYTVQAQPRDPLVKTEALNLEGAEQLAPSLKTIAHRTPSMEEQDKQTSTWGELWLMATALKTMKHLLRLLMSLDEKPMMYELKVNMKLMTTPS